jgi:hypothetical protein
VKAARPAAPRVTRRSDARAAAASTASLAAAWEVLNGLRSTQSPPSQLHALTLFSLSQSASPTTADRLHPGAVCTAAPATAAATADDDDAAAAAAAPPPPPAAEAATAVLLRPTQSRRKCVCECTKFTCLAPCCETGSGEVRNQWSDPTLVSSSMHAKRRLLHTLRMRSP